MFRLFALALATVAIPSAARADIVLTFERTDPFRDVRLFANGRDFNPMPAGTMVFTGSPSATAEGFGATVRAYCLDVFSQVSPSGVPATYTVTSPANATAIVGSGEAGLKQAYLTELWGRHAASTDTPDGAAAFALAVWELVYDPVASRDIGGGSLYVAPTTSEAATLAAGWLAGLSGDTTQFTNNPLYAGFELVALDSANNQDQLTVRPTAVPAPAGVVLLMLGAAALGVRRRFRAA